MKVLLKNKQLLYLFLCNFGILFIGFGLFPLLPLYAAELGASSSFIGLYLAITYIAISAGSILAGQLSERLPRKAVFTAAGWLGTPALFLLGHTRSLWMMVLLTALVWFAGGVGLSISNVLTSLHTSSSTRGKAFGLLSLASPLGALIGGLSVGRLMEWGGYPMMFTALAAVWTLYPVLAWAKVQDKPTCLSSGRNAQALSSAQRPGTLFLILLATVFLASMTVSIGRMGLSMTMKSLQYSASEVSMANAFGGLVTIPITLLIGVLSDRLGRKYFLLIGYLLAMGGTLVLVHSQELWQFWLVSSLALAARSVISAMGPAYATDVLSRRALGKSLPLVGTMNWVSGVLGFGGAGYILDVFGPAVLYEAATVMAVVAGMVIAFQPGSLKTKVASSLADTKDRLSPAGD